MVLAHAVTVKNTFINILENSENDSAAFPRQWSDPLPRFGSVDTQEQGAANTTVKAAPADVSDVMETPQTSVGYDDAESDWYSQEDSSSVDTPIKSPSSHTVADASLGSLDAAGVLLQQQMWEKPANATPMDIPREWHGKTSVMVRNISYKCSRTMFREELNKAGFQNQYDFIYVPVSVGRGNCKGYAFVNFVDDRIAYRFKVQFDGFKMNVPGSVKRLEVIPANLQGYAQNASHYIAKQSENASTPCSGPTSQSRLSASGDDRSCALGASEDQPTPACRQCGARVLSRARFCHRCGVAL
eukprot:TRINITY_DN23565_c0_g2_i1.p1 TRINITY_DN23565_c0_g2~~TRINITY_DN23565_c0_g2_i1.p1  ORF type:complete len:300 (+),score=38.74 TRINITY_DN23565_c0_g2_i1:61-960(+)